jgi:hypothetical protein
MTSRSIAAACTIGVCIAVAVFFVTVDEGTPDAQVVKENAVSDPHGFMKIRHIVKKVKDFHHKFHAELKAKEKKKTQHKKAKQNSPRKPKKSPHGMPLVKQKKFKGLLPGQKRAVNGHGIDDDEDRKGMKYMTHTSHHKRKSVLPKKGYPEGMNRMVGNRVYKPKVIPGNPPRVKPPGYVVSDSYLHKGHLFIGPSRRRIGAGFGRRRVIKSSERSQKKKCGKAIVSGTVSDDTSPTRDPLKAIKVTFVDAKSKEKTVTTTDAKGMYKTKLSRCSKFHMYLDGGVGFIKEATAGPGACKEALGPIESHSVVWNAGMSRPLAAGQTVVSLVWQNDMKKVKDLDLHVFVRDLPPKQKAHIALRGTAFTYKASPESDIGLHPHNSTTIEQCHAFTTPPCSKVNYLHTGFREHSPYVKFQTDHGSVAGNEKGGGPETIHIYKELPRQYDIGVDCFSCDEKEVPGEHGWAEDVKIPLTYKALRSFQLSQATVKVYRGNSQVFCKRIEATPGHPHTWWRVATLMCDGKLCSMVPRNNFDPSSPTVAATKRAVLRAGKVPKKDMSVQAAPSLRAHPSVAGSKFAAKFKTKVTAVQKLHLAKAKLQKEMTTWAKSMAYRAIHRPLGCFWAKDDKHKKKLGWKYVGISKSLVAARNLCEGYRYVALECPRPGGFKVFCVKKLPWDAKISGRECTGRPIDHRINKGSNGKCTGPFKWRDAITKNIYGGGFHRATLYVNYLPHVRKALALAKRGHFKKAFQYTEKHILIKGQRFNRKGLAHQESAPKKPKLKKMLTKQTVKAKKKFSKFKDVTKARLKKMLAKTSSAKNSTEN